MPALYIIFTGFGRLLIIPESPRVKYYIHEKLNEHLQRGQADGGYCSFNAAISFSRRNSYACIRFRTQPGIIKRSCPFSHVE